MKLSAVQTRENVAGMRSSSPAETFRGMEEVFDLTAKAVSDGAGIVCTIEATNPCGFLTDPMEERARRISEVNRNIFRMFSTLSENALVIAGLYTAREGSVYNSAVLFDRGDVVGIYDKVHLPAPEQGTIIPGAGFSIFDTSAGRVGPLVCWDMQYPESGRILALMGADLLACPTWGWENIFRCRAYENSVPMLVAMGVPERGEIWEGCDPSCIVDNMGRILASGSRTESGIISAEMELGLDPPPQYDSAMTGKTSMRDIRRSQRVPDRYGYLSAPVTELDKRYDRKLK